MPSRRTADFWLVQPLVRHDLLRFDGFGSKFGTLDMRDDAYITELLDKPARRMCEQGPVIEPKAVRAFGVPREVFFVGAPDRLEPVTRGFHFWLTRRRSKTWSYCAGYFQGRPSALFPNLVAWWSLTDDVMWTFNPDTALELFDAIGSERATVRP